MPTFGPPPPVYPRGCGATIDVYHATRNDWGLSPRVRGNLEQVHRLIQQRGSIPAGAGQPRPTASTSTTTRVYPRGCGATVERGQRTRWGRGLSPRVRGNPSPRAAGPDLRGSIPAGAGQPSASSPLGQRNGVYPRGCGATAIEPIGDFPVNGLSPRVRGNRVGGGRPVPRAWSIPAGAGQPPSWRDPPAAPGVYPRGCGATRVALGDLPQDPGLSPRVRGNPRGPGRSAAGSGSIPAGAGQPFSLADVHGIREVYPRGCGATSQALLGQVEDRGLSPRVRGNRTGRRATRPSPGSIPAGAGQPFTVSPASMSRRVYPRGCGATSAYPAYWLAGAGLSPRVRGNRPDPREALPRRGSIPAGAGQPRERLG